MVHINTQELQKLVEEELLAVEELGNDVVGTSLIGRVGNCQIHLVVTNMKEEFMEDEDNVNVEDGLIITEGT